MLTKVGASSVQIHERGRRHPGRQNSCALVHRSQHHRRLIGHVRIRPHARRRRICRRRRERRGSRCCLRAIPRSFSLAVARAPGPYEVKEGGWGPRMAKGAMEEERWLGRAMSGGSIEMEEGEKEKSKRARLRAGMSMLNGQSEIWWADLRVVKELFCKEMNNWGKAEKGGM
eukprot:4825960-Pleurochrysis_carterae.AAC.1